MAPGNISLRPAPASSSGYGPEGGLSKVAERAFVRKEQWHWLFTYMPSLFLESTAGVCSDLQSSQGGAPLSGVQDSPLGVLSACLQDSVPFLDHSGHPSFPSLESFLDLRDPQWGGDEQKNKTPAVFNTCSHTHTHMYRYLLYTPTHRPVHIDRREHADRYALLL